MEDSILKSTRKALQIGIDDDSFDLDVIMHINSAFSTLNQLGVGLPDGFVIEDDSSVWDDFLPSSVTHKAQISRVKSYVWIHSRLLFDPPELQALLTALQNQKTELEFRLSVDREGAEWQDPDNPVDVVDGGDPLNPYEVTDAN
jgi:hypothetical protein